MRMLLALLIGLLIASCGEDDLEFPGGSNPTNTPSASSTPGSTSTPTPTSTATP